jgi:hypothetical protein
LISDVIPAWSQTVYERLPFGDYSSRLDLVHIHPVGGIFSGIAGSAVISLHSFGAGLFQAVDGKIRNGISADVFTDLFD